MRAKLRACGKPAVLFALLLASTKPAWSTPKGSRDQQSHANSTKPEKAPKVTPEYDPSAAKKDIDVGTFYLRRGDVYAAIARYRDAVKKDPRFAKARLLLCEAYEKKGERATAVKCYKEYLRMFPSSRDGKKVRKNLDRLSKAG